MATSTAPIRQALRRYNAVGHYLRELFGVPVYKVNVDAGFTCPNRDGTLSAGGCIYCNNDSFRPSACVSSETVSSQISRGIPYLRRRYGAERFLVYFQAYTNTYAPLETLARLYKEALDHPGVVGLAIGTRPDCVDPEKISLLEDLARDHFILVEYGLQSVHNSTLKYINRGHDFAAFRQAVEMTARKGIHIGAHLILGFPTETRDQMLQMAPVLSGLPIGFLKLHQLQVIRDTVLADQYTEKPFAVLGYEEYIGLVADFLDRLRSDIVIQRLFAAAPTNILIAPVWERSRSEFLRDLDTYLERTGAYQGRLYKR